MGGGVTSPVDASGVFYVYGTAAQLRSSETNGNVVVTVDQYANGGTTCDQITLIITGPDLTKALSIASAGATTADLTAIALGNGAVSADNVNVTITEPKVSQTLPDTYTVTLGGDVPFYSGNSLTGTNSNDWAVKFTLDNVVAATSKVVSVTTTDLVDGLAGVSPAVDATLAADGILYVYGNYQSIYDLNTVTVVLDRDGDTDTTTTDQLSIVIETSGMSIVMVDFNEAIDLAEDVSTDAVNGWSSLDLNHTAGYITATNEANTVTIAGKIPFYTTALTITGDNDSTLTGQNIWAFYIALDDLRSDSTGITITPTNCVAKIDYANKRLYVSGTASQIFCRSCY